MGRKTTRRGAGKVAEGTDQRAPATYEFDSTGTRINPKDGRPIPGGHKKRWRAQDVPGAGPARGGPASGPGWGGPPKGAGASKFTSENQPAPEIIRAGIAAAKTAKEAAKHHAVRAVQVWAEIMDDPAAPPAARVVAADKIVERAEGKADQAISHSGDVTILTPAQRQARIEALQRKLGGGMLTIEGKIASDDV